MISSDKQLVEALAIFMNPRNTLNEEQEGELLNEIESYQNGCWEILYSSKEKLTPEEVLKKARELNKPILL